MAEREVKLFSNAFMAGAFAVVNFVMLLLLIWTVTAEYAPEWKKYQREYYRLFAERVDDPELKKKILATPLTIKQIWNPELNIIDRCTTCHLGVTNPKMTDVPQPYRVHPNFTQHRFEEIGCTSCHEGQGFATTKHDAHVMEDLEARFGPFDEQHMGWERPMLPLDYVEASCNKCHNVMEAPIPGAERLNAGWRLVQEKGCRSCHVIGDSGAKLAPELNDVGTKFYNESGHSEAFHNVRFGYLKESLRCPQANLSHEAAEKCKATYEPPAAAGGPAQLAGADLVQKYQCVNCHSFDSPARLVGPSLYDIGKRRDAAYIRESILEPDKVVVPGYPPQVMRTTLAGLGFYDDVRKEPAIVDALVQYLVGLKGEESTARAEGAAAPAATSGVVMPDFHFTDEELQNVVIFLLSLQEHTVRWPQKSFAKPVAAQPAPSPAVLTAESGEELARLAGCNACHKFDGPGRLVGPSLYDIGARRDRAYILESILDPDKDVVPGYPKGVMKATLESAGFYKRLTVEALEKLVDYLVSLKGS